MPLEMNVSLHGGRFDLTMQDISAGLFGASGAGKSTILGLVAGTLQPHSGRIALDGRILFDSRKGIMVPREQRPVGAVLQNDPTLSGETVKASLDSAYERTLRQRRWLKPSRLIEMLALGSLLDRKIECVSAGERQRVALARALLKSPRLLLLDEPFAPLGYSVRAQLWPLLRRVETEFKLPVLYASHSLGEILELTHWLIVVSDGRITGSGSLRDLARGEASVRYLGLRQVENILSATVTAHDAEDGCTLARTYGVELVLPPRPHLAIGKPVQLSIRSSDIALSRHFLAGISMQNQIKGRVCALIPTGDGILVQIDCGTTLLVGITPRACRDMALREGDTVYCLAKTQSFTYLTEAGTPALQRVLNRGGEYFWVGSQRGTDDDALGNAKPHPH